MPSPLAHAAVGYALYRLAGPAGSDAAAGKTRDRAVRFLVCAGVSWLPDMDVLPGLWAGDIGRYHYRETHSLLVAAAVAGVTVLATRFGRDWSARRSGAPRAPEGAARVAPSRRWGILVGLGYTLHLLMDAFTQGRRGVMLFWPLSTERFQAPVTFFHGFRYAEPWNDPIHLDTLVNELTFSLALLLLLWRHDRARGRGAGFRTP